MGRWFRVRGFEAQVIADGGTSLQRGSCPNLGGRLPVGRLLYTVSGKVWRDSVSLFLRE